MRVYASIWDGDNWATEGGRIKINWANAPFIAKFAQFRPRACYWNGLLVLVNVPPIPILTGGLLPCTTN